MRAISSGLSAVLLGASLLVACARTGQSVAPAGDTRKTLEFSLSTIDGRLVSSTGLRGRTTVLLFVTTFDLSSQEQAKRLEDLFRTHEPRLNVLGVVLEPPRYVDLARTFREMLGLNYDLAMAGQDALEGRGPFAEVRAVPAWIVLDRTGQPRAAHTGPLSAEALRELVALAEEGASRSWE